MKKRIAIFDLSITADSPAGSCILHLIRNLADDYQFIVFADRFDNPNPQKIVWVRVPLPDKPVIARYVGFKYLAPIYYKRFVQQHTKPDLAIATEGEFAECDICYVHFCHRAYLKEQRLKLSSISSPISSLRNTVRFLNHHFNAYAEAEAIAKASKIVVPSLGLAQQLSQTYGPTIQQDIATISNPIDVEHFTRPKDYDAESGRAQLGFAPTDIVLVFVALGSFGRKGLDFVLQALARLRSPQLKLLVVGGNRAEISEYTHLCAQLDVAESTTFVGLQSDVRPYLWLGDLFVLPSSYETFSLVTFQAAIAGLPIMATQLYGVAELLEPGVNGWLIERHGEAIAQTLERVVDCRGDLLEMGAQAHKAAAEYGISRFVEQWRQLLNQQLQLEMPSAIAAKR